MMAAEIGNEEPGSVSAGTAGGGGSAGGGGGPQSGQFPILPIARVRTNKMVYQSQNSDTDSNSKSEVCPCPLPPLPVSGGQPPVRTSGDGYSAAFGTGHTVGSTASFSSSNFSLGEGQGNRNSPSSGGPDGSASTNPASPQPAVPQPACGGQGNVDESDMMDGQEYEEEEVAFPLSAPPTNQWYHGKLDRTIAEERLRQARNPGSYLIRESDRRPGSFVLSFLSKTNVVNHFRIIAMCGDFYIGGRRFSSLSDLIGYYSYVSCLLKGEKLLSPVAPPEPVEDRRRVRAILPYTKVPDTDEISFLKGDMFIVHNEDEDGWMWVTNVRTDEQGLIVEDLVEEVGREEDPHEGKVIDDIIDHYKKEQIVEGYTLKQPVSVQHHDQVLIDIVDGKEIYNTIRRKTKDAFYKNIVRKGYLQMNKGKSKRWKNLYFILEGNDSQLIYFESEKRATKPKGLIDLSVCSVYGVHDSLFGRDLASETNRFEITLSNKTKKNKDSDILFMRCQLCRLPNGQVMDEWFPLSSHIPLKGIEPGSLRVRSRYSMEKIMPEEEYSEFKELILQKDYHVIYALGHVCGQDRTLLASILLRVFRHEKSEAPLLRALNDKEISMEDEATTLFRATTLSSTLMEQYMKATATPFVHHALKDTILKIMESKQSCENVPELPESEHFTTDLSRDLAALHEICVTHSDELRTLSNERGAQQHSLKKLLAITELLQQKQNQYSMSNNNR
ncbi:RASA1 protein, partial [Polypterus senegalus]